MEVVGAFGGLLTQLGGRSDANGPLIDQTTVLFGSNPGNANAHTAHDLPILVAGGGYAHGKHIVNEGDENAPPCNLFVTLLRSRVAGASGFRENQSTIEIEDDARTDASAGGREKPLKTSPP